MKSRIIRQMFLDFFKKNGHKVLPPAPLIVDDPTVLFTTAGMQQFREYYLDPSKAPAKKVVTAQPTFRTSDIDLVGDSSHLTFFEMLGNFSFGDYFKEEAIKLSFEFVTKELKINPKRISISVFKGDKEVPKDKESIRLWQKIGLPERKIKLAGRKDNFWGPVGNEGPCGPTTEIYVDNLEIWNLVFNEYYCDDKKKLTPLKYQGVDTGMGLERLAVVLSGEARSRFAGQNKKTVYETDLHQPIIKTIRGYEDRRISRSERILADHIRGIVFLTAEGLTPSNKEQGYVLRRLIRRILVHGRLLGIKESFLGKLAQCTVVNLGNGYPFLKKNQKKILATLSEEEERFSKTLDKGLKEFEKLKAVSGKTAFYLYDTFGFPLELTEELAKKKKIRIDKKEFELELEKQRAKTRAAAPAKTGVANPKLHTAVHLLHRALQIVLGGHALQRGQDITGEVLRFDFAHPQKLTDKEIKKIEQIVNQKIKENLPVVTKETTVAQAKKEGAMALFLPKYGKTVTQYSIGNFSKELCGGPHIKRTGELGKFKIISEKSSASGVRRIKAKVV
ncbi:alanine--tRNA ligase [Candidatus Berkelbacteria bacterium]|nr:alanine--tRNA ligase [Candidatus Berkelbacteria bacterium]